MTDLSTPWLQRKRACADRALACKAMAVASQLTIRTRTWSGGRRDVGTKTDSDLVLPKKYAIRELSTREILASGGRLEKGDVAVTEIVPAYPALGANAPGGLTREQLCPDEFLSSPATNTFVEVIYIIDGDISGYFTRASLETADPVFWRLVLSRTRDLPRQGDLS